jgi:uncharacterized protein YbjT (DUF2867 family)
MNLVVGATGVVGGKAAEHLLVRGEPVRALVRKESPGRSMGPHTHPDHLRALGAEIVHGDLTDPAGLGPALEGVRCVVSTANTAKRTPDFDGVDWQGTRDLIDAAAAAGVEQFVYLSAHGAEAGSPVPLFDAKGRAEAHLAASGLDYAIVRPVMFMEDWIAYLLGAQLGHGGEIRLMNGGEKTFSFVSAADVARLIATLVGHPEARDRVLPLSAGSRTHREIASLIGSATGQDLPVSSVSPGEEIPGLPPVMVELWAGMTMGPDVDLATPEIEREFGVPLQSIGEFVKRAFGADG